MFNKVDLLDAGEAEARAKAIADSLGWEDKYYLISAANREGITALCWDIMAFLNANPKELVEKDAEPEKAEFMWDDYHRTQLSNADAHVVDDEDDDDWDDWDDEDDEGVEIIYER